MAVRLLVGLVAAAAFTVGLVFQMLWLTVCGLVGLLIAVVIRSGSNPLAATYRDVREPPPVERKKDW